MNSKSKKKAIFAMFLAAVMMMGFAGVVSIACKSGAGKTVAAAPSAKSVNVDRIQITKARLWNRPSG